MFLFCSQLLYRIPWRCFDSVSLLTACTSSVKVEQERTEISKYNTSNRKGVNLFMKLSLFQQFGLLGVEVVSSFQGGRFDSRPVSLALHCPSLLLGQTASEIRAA